MEVFGAIRAAVAQTSDAAVMTGSMMKQRAVLVDHEVRRDRRRELHQVHVLLCVVARRHVAAAESMAATRLAVAPLALYVRPSARRAARRYSAGEELGGRRRAQFVRRVALSTRSP